MVKQSNVYFLSFLLVGLMAACGNRHGGQVSEMPETAVSVPETAVTDSQAKPAAGGQDVRESTPVPAYPAAEGDMAQENVPADNAAVESARMPAPLPGEDLIAIGPAWLALPLTDARSGETFALADFAGKTIFVETMATWCSNCRRQLINVREAKGRLDGTQFLFVALSVETTIGDAELARFADNEGFDWLFAVATPELLQALANEFGRTIVNPPSTPHFIVRPDGSTTSLSTGIDAPDTLVSQLQAEAAQ